MHEWIDEGRKEDMKEGRNLSIKPNSVGMPWCYCSPEATFFDLCVRIMLHIKETFYNYQVPKILIQLHVIDGMMPVLQLQMLSSHYCHVGLNYVPDCIICCFNVVQYHALVVCLIDLPIYINVTLQAPEDFVRANEQAMEDTGKMGWYLWSQENTTKRVPRIYLWWTLYST